MTDVSTIDQAALDALEAKAAELEKFKNDSAPQLAEYEKAKSEWEEKEKQYQADLNPNWAKARKQIDALKAVAKEKGVEIDDEGNVKSNPQNVDVNQIRQEAVNAARGELLGGRLEELLGEYEPESAQLVKHFYDKLTAGETVTLKNIKSYVTQAENAARGNPDNKIARAAGYSGGGAPRQPAEGKADEKVISDLAGKMNLPFIKAKN